MTQTRKPYYVNEQGEVVEPPATPEQEQEQHLTIINPLNPGNMLPSMTNLPLHYQALHLETLNAEEAEEAMDMLHTYTQVVPSDLKTYSNTIITILGAVLKQNQEYNSKKTGEMAPGYYNVLLKIDKIARDEVTGEEYKVIVKSSSKTVAEVMVSLMALRGFGDWVVPYKALVKVAPDNRQFLQRAVEQKKGK